MYRIGSDYVAGKWGRFLRAPDLYFRLIKDYRSRLVRVGEIAEVKRGITSGCDDFFMPRDVTQEVLGELKEGLPWNDVGLMTPCKRSEIESGKVRIVRAGDNTLHPVETKYLKPEVHSLMQVDRPVIRAGDLEQGRPLGQRTACRFGTFLCCQIYPLGCKEDFSVQEIQSCSGSATHILRIAPSLV